MVWIIIVKVLTSGLALVSDSDHRLGTRDPSNLWLVTMDDIAQCGGKLYSYILNLSSCVYYFN